MTYERREPGFDLRYSVACILRMVILVLVGAGCAGCLGFGTSSPTDTLLEEAFAGIKADDWQRFQKLTITPADFMIRDMGLSAFKAPQSYAGGVLRPRQRDEQRRQFDEAVRGGPGLIDFQRSAYVGPGSLLDSGTRRVANNGSYSYEIWSITIETGEGEVDTTELFPRFTIVKWGDEWRILGLIME